VASGKEVTIHEAPISAHGFSGSGYTVIDPQTGAGAYIIEGGARGAILAVIGGLLILAGTVAAALTAGAAAVQTLAVVSAGVLFTYAAMAILHGDVSGGKFALTWAVNILFGALALTVTAGGVALAPEIVGLLGILLPGLAQSLDTINSLPERACTLNPTTN
jgi:hypothetical protein